ncbi:MAG: hypothetical protein IJV35_04680 [Neisseriaceae bacterium]|nr:hypothetical protein [Neisseriaceae bacterium]
MAKGNGSLSTGKLLRNYLSGTSSFLVETGNMVSNIKQYMQTGDTKYLHDAWESASIATGHLTSVVSVGKAGGLTSNVLTANRLLNHLKEFKTDWNNGQINVNLTQNIMADSFSLMGEAFGKRGIIFSETGDIISAIALNTGDTGKMDLEDFNAEDIEGFIIENLQPLSDAIYGFFDKWDKNISAKLDGRDPSFGKAVLEKLLKLSDGLDNLFSFDWAKFDWTGDDWKDWFGLNRTGLFHIYDPLVLDLDGDGVELVNANGWNGVQFDFNGNGIQTATQWVKADDGLLVWDRNNNGVIDDGSELFGQDTPHRFLGEPVTDGFTALRTVESHPDGEINAKDHEWKNLKVWRDLNQDGETQKGELFTLDKLGITALSLSAQNGTATFTYQDGKKNKLADVNFNRDTVHSEYKEHIALSEAQLKLPNLHGVGMLRDLRKAANSEFFAQYTTAFQAA